MDAVERFGSLVAGEAPILVDEGALLIAAHLDPHVDPARERVRLDDMASAVREPTLDGVRHLLFDDLGFAGDRRTYYDPRNSLLPVVLDRRLGIPISLSVLTMAVGRRVGAPVDGVGMPGHFLVRDRVDRGVFVDPFSGGLELDRAGCERRFREVQGPGARFEAAFLDPVDNRDILARMLANLRAIHNHRRERDALARVLTLVTRLPDSDEEDARQLADVLTAAGRFDEAAAVHDRLGRGGDGEDRRRATKLRARLN